MEIKTLTLVTAKAAREISDNIIDNDIGVEIPKIMNKIIATANEGNIRCSHYCPSNWTYYQRCILMGFIRKLGYKVDMTNSGTLIIEW